MMNKKWELFQRGMKRAEWLGKPDGAVMEWSNESGLTLFVFYEKPTEDEMRDISAGARFEIGFKDINGVGFFAIKFGEQDWLDCAFSPNLYRQTPVFEKPKDGKTYALHIMLVDTSVGELKIMRSIALGVDFTEHFRLWCLNSLDKNMSSMYYNRIVDNAFLEYSSPKEIADVADVKWVRTHGEEVKERDELEKN